MTKIKPKFVVDIFIMRIN